jgi:hypothetical protein
VLNDYGKQTHVVRTKIELKTYLCTWHKNKDRLVVTLYQGSHSWNWTKSLKGLYSFTFNYVILLKEGQTYQFHKVARLMPPT